MANCAISRKFNYMRRLKSILCHLRANVIYKRNFRRKIAESTTMHKKNLLARFFSVFKETDALGKERESRMIDHVGRKRRQILMTTLSALLTHRDTR